MQSCSLSTIGSLSNSVFERRTSTGSEAFSLFIWLDANKLVLLSFFSLLKTIYPRVSTKPLPNDAKSPLPVDVRRSKTLLLKLPIVDNEQLCTCIVAFFAYLTAPSTRTWTFLNPLIFLTRINLPSTWKKWIRSPKPHLLETALHSGSEARPNQSRKQNMRFQ